MPFEYDPKKSAANKAKHGLDFEEAQGLWKDPHLLELDTRSRDEQRTLAIGMVGGKVWSAIFTLRDGIIRLISVRRARKEEVEFYESDQGD
jgi:uncharacterized DUF497 family protein